MKLIQIRISKAATVPATNTRFQFRTEWRFIHKISYEESNNIFKVVGNIERGFIETDAQFAKWLVDNFGNGRYHLHVWQKGRSGWSFYNFNCVDKDRFNQVKKHKTEFQKEKENLVKEYKQKVSMHDEETDDQKRKDLKEEIEELTEDIDMDSEIIKSEQSSSKIKFFANTQSLYREHSYEDYSSAPNQMSYDNSIW